MRRRYGLVYVFALAAARDPEQARAAYREFTHARDASYFRIEARGDASPPGGAPAAGGPSGYDRIGLQAMGALLGDEPEEMVVNTRNRTPLGGPAVPELPADDVVEVAALVGKGGITPIPQPPLPVPAGDLLRRVKAAEREFVRAALAGDPDIAAEALREHPAGGPEAAAVFGNLRMAAAEA